LNRRAPRAHGDRRRQRMAFLVSLATTCSINEPNAAPVPGSLRHSAPVRTNTRVRYHGLLGRKPHEENSDAQADYCPLSARPSCSRAGYRGKPKPRPRQQCKPTCGCQKFQPGNLRPHAVLLARIAARAGPGSVVPTAVGVLPANSALDQQATLDKGRRLRPGAFFPLAGSEAR
jgi:hypothetical protein